jgi:hypothetical protein
MGATNTLFGKVCGPICMKQGNQEKVKVAEKGGTIVIAQNFSS